MPPTPTPACKGMPRASSQTDPPRRQGEAGAVSAPRGRLIRREGGVGLPRPSGALPPPLPSPPLPSPRSRLSRRRSAFPPRTDGRTEGRERVGAAGAPGAWSATSAGGIPTRLGYNEAALPGRRRRRRRRRRRGRPAERRRSRSPGGHRSGGGPASQPASEQATRGPLARPGPAPPRASSPVASVSGRRRPASSSRKRAGGRPESNRLPASLLPGLRALKAAALFTGIPPTCAPMASRILHRLRHVLTGEGDRDGLAGCSSEAEEFPESSELEDDTEGLSTRLSGTLSFTSNDEEEEEEEEEEDAGEATQEWPLNPDRLGAAADNGEHSPPGTERQGSNLLTRQLQELWRKSRGTFVPQRLLFEVTSANVVSEHNSKYVLYTIYLIRTGQFDKAPATIARRYSDFERLNRHLRRQFGTDMAGVSFPRKRLRRNFAAETIAKRSRAFEQFLAHLHSLPEIRRSATFLEFFFLGDLREAQRATCSGMYCQALAAWTNAQRLQEKLGVCHSGHFLVTLAGLAVCQQELEQFGEAHASCEQALQLLEGQDSHPLVAPFLQTYIHLSWMLGRDKRRAEARLQGLQDAGGGGMPPPTLKELLIKQPLP